MTKEFQVYYDPNHLHRYSYYLGFDSLLDSELIKFHKAINKQFKDYDNRFLENVKSYYSFHKYENVIEHREFRKFSFYLQNWMLAPVDNENPGFVIANIDMLPDKDKLIQNSKLEFKINSKMLPKIREELLKLNQLDRLK